jgi:hypothetical protein
VIPPATISRAVFRAVNVPAKCHAQEPSQSIGQPSYSDQPYTGAGDPGASGGGRPAADLWWPPWEWAAGAYRLAPAKQHLSWRPSRAWLRGVLPVVEARLELESEGVGHPLQRGDRRPAPAGLEAVHHGLCGPLDGGGATTG